MAATLTAAGITHILPRNLWWKDEYQWEPVTQQRNRALDGSLHIQETEKVAGRPITLTGAWVERQALQTLHGQALNTTEPMELKLDDGRTLQVRWRRGDQPALRGEPVHPSTAPPEDHLYKVTLRLITV